MADQTNTTIPDAILERVGRAIADADQEDYMEDCVIYDKRAAAAIRAYEQAKAMEAANGAI